MNYMIKSNYTKQKRKYLHKLLISNKIQKDGRSSKIVKNTMFSHIYEVDCFQKEFVEMSHEKFVLKPPYPRYQKWLIRKLNVLEELQEGALKLRDFECLEGTSPKLYSMRYPKSKLNSRVIYTYLDEGEILLLTAFKEKSSSDYNRHIKLAQRRISALEGE